MSSKILRGFLSIIGGKVGTLLITVTATPLITRIVGSTGYGDYAFILSILGIITIFTRMGISTGIRKYIVEDREQQNWSERVFGFYFQLGFFLSFSTALILVFATELGLISRLFDDDLKIYFYFLCGIIIAENFIYVFRYTLMGLNFEHYSEPLIVLRRALSAALGVSLAYTGYGVAGLLGGMLASAAVCSVVAFLILREKLSFTAAFQSIPADVPYRELIGFNVSNTVLIFLTMSLYNIDILLVQYFVGSQQTGFYKSALVIAEFLWFVPIAIQTVFIHSTSEMWSKDQHQRISMVASRATRYTLCLTVLLAIGLAALAEPFVSLYFGSEFSAAVTPLLLLLPGVIGFAVARPIYAVGQGKGALRILIYATGTAAFVNLVLNLLLIPQYGMHGAAVATSIGYGSMVFLHVWSANKIGFTPIADLRLLRITVTAVLSTPVIFGLARLITHDFLALVVVPPVGFLVYAVLTLKTGAIDLEELSDLLDQLPEPMNRLSAHF